MVKRRKKENLALGGGAAAFLENRRGEEDLLADHSVVFVVGFVSITELTVWPEFLLKNSWPNFPLCPT